MTNKQKEKREKKKLPVDLWDACFHHFSSIAFLWNYLVLFSPSFAPIGEYGAHADICVHIGAHLHVYAFIYVYVWKPEVGVACFP